MDVQQPTRTTKRANRRRFAAALCAASVVAVALAGNLVSAGADDPSVPGEDVAAPPTQIAPSKPPGPAGDEPTTTATTPATTAQPAADAKTETAADPPAGADQPAASATGAPSEPPKAAEGARTQAPSPATSTKPLLPTRATSPLPSP